MQPGDSKTVALRRVLDFVSTRGLVGWMLPTTPERRRRAQSRAKTCRTREGCARSGAGGDRGEAEQAGDEEKEQLGAQSERRKERREELQSGKGPLEGIS